MDWETIDRDLQVLEIMAGKQPSPPKDYSHNVRDDKVEEPEAPVAEAAKPVEQNEVQTESVEADKKQIICSSFEQKTVAFKPPFSGFRIS